MLLRYCSRTILVMFCLSLFGGCATYRYIPAENSAAVAASDVTLPVAMKVAAPEFDKAKTKKNNFYLSKSELKKIQTAMTATAAGSLNDLSPAAAQPSSPTLTFTLNRGKDKSHWGYTFLTLITLSLIPGVVDLHFDGQMTVQSGGKTLFTSDAKRTMRQYSGTYFPTPFMLGSNLSAVTKTMVKDMLAQQRGALNQWVAGEKQQYDEQVAGKDVAAQRQWLIAHPDSLFANDVLATLASHPPQHNPLAWHLKNARLFPGYVSFLSEADALWFVGPQGQRVGDLVEAARHGASQSILAAKVAVNGPYKNFTNDEIQRLQQAGLSSDLIAAMIRSTTQRAQPSRTSSAAAASHPAAPGNDVALLLIHDNSGQYMNPWTSDGVLAEWVDKAINAKMGSAVGSAAGAYAANKALSNVPFVGGFLGSKVGKEVGRSAAISAVGGMDYIRRTSDQSFRSLPDMARYLKASYGTDSNFQQAVKAANEIYPGLLRAVSSAK